MNSPKHGDPLEKLGATVDFEMFRSDLVAALGPRDRAKGGRPSFDPVLKFRMLVLQAMHGLSLDQTEYLVADRLSWMRFCGLGLATLDGGQFQRCSVAQIAALTAGAKIIVAIESRRDIGDRRALAHPGAPLQHHGNGVQIRTSPRRL